MESWDILIPAGGRTDDALRAASGSEFKPLVSLGGRTILETVTEAALAWDQTRRVYLLCEPEVPIPASLLDRVIRCDAFGSAPRKILTTLQEQTDLAERVLVLTADMPFLTSEMLTPFTRELQPEAEFAAAIYQRKEFEARFPASDNTFLRIADGAWTSGGVFAIRTEAFVRNRQRLEDAFAARKSIFKLAKLLGWGTLFAVVTRRATVPQLVERIEGILGCRIQPIRHAPVELAFDIDHASDLIYARKLLAPETT